MSLCSGWLRMLAAGVAAFPGLLCASGAVADTSEPALGLIVKLRNGAPTEASVSARLASLNRRGDRLRRVINEARLDGGSVRYRPVGNDAHHVDFGRVLELREAKELARTLRSRPDVEWVVPNTIEKRMAQPNPPDPNYFPVTANGTVQLGQWWLYRVSGSSSNALVDRLRGVPGFEAAWDLETGATSVAPVAVLDTGITSHPDLAGVTVLPGHDFISHPVIANDGDGGRDTNPRDPGDWVSQEDKDLYPSLLSGCLIEDSSWHGTNTAGLIAATTSNGIGNASINWNARIVPVRVAGKCGAALSDVLDAMKWSAGIDVCLSTDTAGNCTAMGSNPNPVKVINFSFGGAGNDRLNCVPYQPVIDELALRNVVIVAPAGNEQMDVPRPARCPGVIGVGAVNRDGFKTNYSNFGAELTVSTVGGDPKYADSQQTACAGNWGCLLGDGGLLSLDNRGATNPGTPWYAYVSGTSFSAPIVAGTISLMLSANPALTHSQIVDGLKRSARPHVRSDRVGICSATNFGRCICTEVTCGKGLLDAAEAVRYAQTLFGGQVFTPRTWSVESIDGSSELTQALALGPDEPVSDEVGSSGGGGGAVQPVWLVALALVSLLLVAQRRCAVPRSLRPRRR